MPTASLIEIENTWTRRADPDPVIGVGESYDANKQYRYTYLRVGNVVVKMHGRERGRRVLQNLSTVIANALAVMDLKAPSESDDEDYVPTPDDSASVRTPKAARARVSRGKK